MQGPQSSPVPTCCAATFPRSGSNPQLRSPVCYPTQRAPGLSLTLPGGAAGPALGRGHRTVPATAFLPSALPTYSQHPPYRPQCGKATEPLYLHDPAGGRHLAAHHDPEKGQLPGRSRAAAITGVLGSRGRALYVASRGRGERADPPPLPA